MINLIIEKEAISSNHKIYGVNKANARFLYKKERNELEKRLCAIIGKGHSQERVSLKISRKWGKGKRAFDEANLIGGFKILIDCLVSLGHLKDDSPDYFKGYYFQSKSESETGYIEIKQLEPIGELETAMEYLAEYMEVDKETLLKAANKSKLIKGN